jgi:hypothetical protein
MVLFHPNFYEDDFITLGDLKANFLERNIRFVREYNSSIFGGADQMIQQYRYIMAPMGIFTHTVQLTINKKAEASFGELDPERLRFTKFSCYYSRRRLKKRQPITPSTILLN